MATRKKTSPKAKDTEVKAPPKADPEARVGALVVVGDQITEEQVKGGPTLEAVHSHRRAVSAMHEALTQLEAARDVLKRELRHGPGCLVDLQQAINSLRNEVEGF